MPDNTGLTPDQRAAHALLSELRTRIATQALPYQHGVEARALESLFELFGLARTAMKDNPGCADFAKITAKTLNVDVRPVTAKWHRAYKSGLLNSRDGANAFRADLATLRPRLIAFSLDLQKMAYGSRDPDDETPPAISEDLVRDLLASMPFGIDRTDAQWNSINDSERKDIAERRNTYGHAAEADVDATGLSLSGGGIRSATFCLGVIQVLAARGLMKDIDYLSTVSGGGFTGGFVSALLGSGGSFGDIAFPYGPDSPDVRHLRQNAKYLSAVNLKQRWFMIAGTLSGLLLNWSAPLAVLSLLALLNSLATVDANFWATFAAASAAITLVAVIAHGIILRVWQTASGTWAVAAGAILTLSFGALALVEWGYSLFHSPHAIVVFASIYMAAIAAPVVLRFLRLVANEKQRRLLFSASLYVAGLTVPLLAALVLYLLRDLGHLTRSADAAWFSPLHYVNGGTLLLAAVIVSAAVAWALNVNLTGPHKLYRDQLAKAFIPEASGADVLLPMVDPKNLGPYHLINATVNLPSSKSPVLKDRKGDFFLFSRHWTGSSATGYTATSSWLGNGKPLDLATAIAVSGAAASPQMGLGSVPALSALMSLLNIRLGYWIRNPRYDHKDRSPGFPCLLREMTGAFMAENSAWLNLSDGGHIENMGLYELLRRRCKFIICVDGEADPESTFQGKLTLVRHAQIDLGIRIEPRLDDMRPDPETRTTRSHSQLFRISYPAAADGRQAGTGLLLYLKLSITGDEAELLKRYRLLNPDFPHQSTLNQFYDEEQFEAYRQLGVHVAEGMFSDALLTENKAPATIRSWFEQLTKNMLEA